MLNYSHHSDFPPYHRPHTMRCFLPSRPTLFLAFLSTGAIGAATFQESFGAEPLVPATALPFSTTWSSDLPLSSSDWPWWRGPGNNGIADEKQKPPTHWSEAENIAWKASIPGRGYGSPTLVGDRLYLLTANEESGAQSLLIFDRNSGALQRTVELHSSGGMRTNSRSTAASSSPASDGERVFVSLPNNGGIWASALSLEGELLWQKQVSDYVEHQGYGASPCIYQGLVIIATDNKGGGNITAFDRKTGDVAWVHERPKLPNYPSPVVLHVCGRDQLIMTGCDLVTSLDPATGAVLWETEGATTECVTTTTTDGQHIFTSGGYPRNHMSAYLADGSLKKVWENDNRLYVPSPLVKDGTLYAVLDAGIAIALDAATGKELWKRRLNGNFSASPVLVGNLIFATNEVGETFVFEATPERYQAVSRSKLGREVFATPVFTQGTIYYRCTEEGESHRNEALYCIRETK